MKLGWFPIGHLLTPTPYHAAFLRYCTSVLKHISDVLSISVAESVLCAMPCISALETILNCLMGYVSVLSNSMQANSPT